MKLYLAGPDVFLLHAGGRAEHMRQLCAQHGCEGVFPFDNDARIAGLEQREAAALIYRENVKLIEFSDGVLANMTPFRGPSLDAGTAFEIGYACALGKPVVGYSGDVREYREKVGELFHGQLVQDDGGWWDPREMRVENFGLTDNLMLACGVTQVCADFEEALTVLLALSGSSK